MGAAAIRVLLVDDDEEDFLITSGVIGEILGGGFRVTWKDSYAAALEAIGDGVFDLLVFDYRLGAETGIDLLLREVKLRGYPAPVNLLTGHQDADIDNEAIRLGAADYLIKGKITPDSFERSARHAMEHHRILSELHESNNFLQSIIDALGAEVAILDAAGTILVVNAAWRVVFDRENTHATAGESYFGVAERGSGDERAAAVALVAGVRQVMAGETASFRMEFPLTASGARRWQIASVSSFASRGERFVVVAYEDITDRKNAEMELERSRAVLEELSIRDELTQLYNRRYFNIVMKEEIERATRYQRSFAVLMLDIDHFKFVNDTYGHGAGDLALRHVARLCQAGCRTTDCAARFGGEEMVFICPETAVVEAMELAERLRVSIGETPVTVRSEGGAERELQVTASFGVAVFPECGTSTEELLLFADKGLYLAKTSGRNRTCYWQP